MIVTQYWYEYCGDVTQQPCLLILFFPAGAGGTGSVGTRLKNLFFEAGFKKLFLNGLGPRCVMIGTLTAGQFAIYDSVMEMTGASKFNFINPDA